jgi:small subunit ribosomal protein S2
MADLIDIKKLFEAGAYFGHKTSAWHPKMARYIHSKRDGIHIINLENTIEAIERAQKLIADLTKGGKTAIFVGTKSQAKDTVKKIAESVSMPYVSERWMGGILTNFQTTQQQISKLKKIESQIISGEIQAKYSKLEAQRFQEKADKMNTLYGGIKDMQALPVVMIVSDIITDDIAIKEAKKKGIPVIGIVDTNADPDIVDVAIPANDDAIKSIDLIMTYLASAVNSKTPASVEG